MPKHKRKTYLKTLYGTTIQPIGFISTRKNSQLWVVAHPDDCSMEFITHIDVRELDGGKEAAEIWLEDNKKPIKTG